MNLFLFQKGKIYSTSLFTVYKTQNLEKETFFNTCFLDTTFVAQQRHIQLRTVALF